MSGSAKTSEYVSDRAGSDRYRVLQLGAGELMRHTIRALQRHGYEVYAVDRDPKAPGFAVADGHAPVDFADAEAVTRYARAIGADFIMPVNDAGLMSASEASAALGLPGVPRDVALRCLDKGEMRLAWHRAGLPQPDFRVVRSLEEAHSAARDVGYPVVVKPTRNWGSRGVSRVRSTGEIEAAYADAKENRGNGAIIVETYLSGVLMSADGLVHDGETSVLILSDVTQQDHDRFLVNFALNYPAAFPPAVNAQARTLIGHATAALGLRTGAFHCELMVVEDRVHLIELAARGGGGHLFGMVSEAGSGICAPSALARLALGLPVDIRPRQERGVCYHFFSAPAGMVEAVHGVEEARSLPGILDFGVQIKPGMQSAAVSNDAARHGYCVAEGASREEAIAAAQAAISMVRFTMLGDPPARSGQSAGRYATR
jgi:biotin carboxylase